MAALGIVDAKWMVPLNLNRQLSINKKTDCELQLTTYLVIAFLYAEAPFSGNEKVLSSKLLSMFLFEFINREFDQCYWSQNCNQKIEVDVRT